MKLKYEITGRHRQNWDATHTTWRDTETEVTEYMAEDIAKWGNYYGYEVTLLVMTAAEIGWQKVAKTYYVDGVEVDDYRYMRRMRETATEPNRFGW